MYHKKSRFRVISPRKQPFESGEGGIRTLGTREGTLAFQASPFDRSGTSPRRSANIELFATHINEKSQIV